MRRPRDPTRSPARTASRPGPVAGVGAGPPPGRLLGRQGSTSGGLADPARSVSPVPDYPDACAPVGVDTSSPCLRITLDAIDAARAEEGLRPMVLPADFPRLTVPEQLFVAVDRERVDRGLAPFTGLTTALDADAQKGRRRGPAATPGPARPTAR